MVLLSVSFLNLNFAQNGKAKTFKIWVEMADSEWKIMGRLLEVKDSSIVVQYWNKEKVKEIDAQDIEKLKFRRKGSIGKGAALGGGAGILTGFLIGMSNGDDPEGTWFGMTAEEKGAWSGFGLGLVGAAAGTVVGSLKKKFVIASSQEQFDSVREDIRRFVSAPTRKKDTQN